MRWLIASSQHHPSHGGIGTYVSRFIAAAKKAGWRVELVTRPSDVHPPCDRVHEIRTADMLPEFEGRLAALRRLERVRPYRYGLWSQAVALTLLKIQGEFDGLEFVDCQAEGFGALVSRAVRKRFGDSRMVIHAHTPMFVEEQINGADISRFGREIYHGWERRAIAAADGVIATSRMLADRLPAKTEPRVIPYPIDEMGQGPSTGRREETIVLVGSVQPRKGVDVWARSLNRVLKERPRAKALLIGPDTTTAPDGLSMAAHAQRLIDPRVIDRFRWLGSLPHHETIDHIARASLVVVPSVFESFSFVAAEALDHGTPTLVSDRVGLAEHIAGLPTAPAGDHEALAEAQLAILGRPEAQAQAIACREAMLRTCSPAQHLNQRIAFVDSLQPSATDDMAATEDGLAELDRFIAGVEASERRGEAVSSAVS